MIRILATLLILTGGMVSAAAPQGALQAVNAFRTQAGAAGLTLDPRLQAAAEAHAAELSRSRRLSHQGANGSKTSQRVAAQGYRWCWVSENLGQGQKALSEVIAAWAASPAHRKNMVNGKARQFGLAVAPGNFWVMVLAKPC